MSYDKQCLICGTGISYEATMCKICSTKHPRHYPRTAELLDEIEPLILTFITGKPVIAVKPLVRRVLRTRSLEELQTNRATVSRLVKYVLNENGYTILPQSSKNSLWMGCEPPYTPKHSEVRA